MCDDHYMRLAIDIAKEGVLQGNTPFGALILKDGEVIARAHNKVWDTTDITAHAEIIAIRKACEKLDSVSLEGCTLYATCEPCPMCFCAAHWANIAKIVFGARIKDAKKLKFRELLISNEQMKEQGKSKVEVVGPFMLKENQELFDYWDHMPGKRTY